MFFPMHGLADYWIYAFVEQRDGIYWVGTWDGANRVDLNTMEFTKYKEELINEWVYGLAVDSRESRLVRHGGRCIDAGRRHLDRVESRRRHRCAQ